MNKILFLVILSVIFLFSFPLSGLAAAYEVHVTISHVYIPERAGMLLAVDRPGTEFILPYGSITVVDKNGLLVTRKDSNGSGYGYSQSLQRGVSLTFPFSYTASLAPYNVHAEFIVLPYGNACAADCSNIPGASSYRTNGYLRYFDPPGGTFYSSATCPTTCGYLSELGVLSTSVFNNSGASYWRSPSLLLIP